MTTGAISRVAIEDGAKRVTVVGGVRARGICGSGLVDAVALGLNDGSILASGRIAGHPKELPVADSLVLYQSDVRELQLAKGAICAGFRLLLRRFAMDASDLAAIHLAGAFGNYVQVESAAAIGLLEAPTGLIRAAGNTALRGAKLMLLATREPEVPVIEHISLAADPGFQEEFAASMQFPQCSRLAPKARTDPKACAG